MRRSAVNALLREVSRGTLRRHAVPLRCASSEPDPIALDDEPPVPKQRRVYTFGSNLNGRLGLNATSTLIPRAEQPQHLAFFDKYNVVAFSGYHKHFLALLDDGRVFAWGSNNCGQLGCGDDKMMGLSLPLDRHAPVLVRTENGEPLRNIVSISAGKYHSAAVDDEGRVWTWGYAGKRRRTFPTVKGGCLLGQTGQRGVYFKFTPWASPVKQFGPVDGMLVESEEHKFEQGSEVNMNPKAVQVACGAVHTLVVDSMGRAWSWGAGDWGRLGHDDMEDREAPCPVVQFLDEKTGMPRVPIESVAACESISLFQTSSGAIYTCGRDTTRQLGMSQEDALHGARFEAINVPTNVPNITQTQSVSLGSHTVLAIAKGGVPFYWGGHAELSRGPQAYTDFGRRFNIKVAKVSVGSGLLQDHRAFVTTDGLLYLTGANTFGQALARTRVEGTALEGMQRMVADLRVWLQSWRSTQLNTVHLDLQCPKFFRDKRVVDVCCAHNSVAVMTEDLDENELKERNEAFANTIKEFEEAELKKRQRRKLPWYKRLFASSPPPTTEKQS